jgi:hypothetical protein
MQNPSDGLGEEEKLTEVSAPGAAGDRTYERLERLKAGRSRSFVATQARAPS